MDSDYCTNAMSIEDEADARPRLEFILCDVYPLRDRAIDSGCPLRLDYSPDIQLAYSIN